MLLFEMTLQVALDGSAVGTNWTLERLLAGVSSNVAFQVAVEHEGLGAVGAHRRFGEKRWC